MWTCQKCGEKHEDQFDSCWRCSNPTAAKTLEYEADVSPLKCLRCETRLKFDGTRTLEGSKDIGLFELIVGYKEYDIYHCPACGKVEFFLNGVGEEMRSPTVPDEN